MPTSYTTLLGLAKPATGELSGTWGTTVNSYITEYLDAAVAGAQVISGSQTAVTLSTTNGSSLVQAAASASGSSQYAIISCTGNPAGLLTVTVPATSKSYLVLNNTSTSQSVKIVGAGPTTGVTVAAGIAALVAWDGSDFALVASTDIAQLSGVLTVAKGGTGITAFGTGVATALGQNVSGSGGIVLATSPTILTSLGLDGNLNITGAARRITGDFSNVTVASRVLFQSSTTNGVTNVRAIPNGTNTSAAIQAGNNSDPNNQSVAVIAAGATEISFQSAINGTGTSLPMTFFTGGSERMRINTSGNVGIGTNSPNDKLTVAAASGNVYAAMNNGTVNLVAGVSAGNVGLIGTTTNQDVLFYANNAERARITAAGNVGIGTNSPAAKFEVQESTSCFSRVSTALNYCSISVIDPQGSPPGPASVGITATANFFIDAPQLNALCVYSTDVSSGFGQRDVYVAPLSGALGYLSSLRSRKTNIESIADVSWLYELNPVSFYYRKQGEGVDTGEPEGIKQLGLIAEEVEQVRPELCFYDYVEGGPPELRGVSYSSLITPLLKAVQQLKEELVEAKARIAALEQK